MDQRHKDKLKEIFDEMNSFENTTITTTSGEEKAWEMLLPAAIASAVSVVDSGQEDLQPSGVMPKPDHTLAVDAQNPFVPIKIPGSL